MSSAGQSRLDVEIQGELVFVTFVDKKILDEGNIQIIGNQLFALVDEDRHRKVILDFRNVEYFSSAAGGKLLTLEKKLRVYDGYLVLCGIRPEIYEVFAIQRTNMYFRIVQTRSDALELFETSARGSMFFSQTSCPIYGCNGLAEASHITELRPRFQVRRTVDCRVCSATLTVTGALPTKGETTSVTIDSFSLPTYENERVEVIPARYFQTAQSRSSSARLAVVKIIGRLDLYTSETVQLAWQSLPQRRYVVFDLLELTEITSQGRNALLKLFQPDQNEVRAVAAVFDATRQLELGPLLPQIPVNSDCWEVWKVFGQIPQNAVSPIKVVVRHAELK